MNVKDDAILLNVWEGKNSKKETQTLRDNVFGNINSLFLMFLKSSRHPVTNDITLNFQHMINSNCFIIWKGVIIKFYRFLSRRLFETLI